MCLAAKSPRKIGSLGVLAWWVGLKLEVSNAYFLLTLETISGFFFYGSPDNLYKSVLKTDC